MYRPSDVELEVFKEFADIPPDELDFHLQELHPDQRDTIRAGVAIYKARRSPADFANVVSGGEWQPAPHLQLLSDILVDASYNQRFIIVSLSVRHGKQLAHDTPILTPDGWTTHGELTPGDYVFGSDGNPVEVIALSDEGLSDYEIEFQDGEVIQCHANHEWVVWDAQRASYQIHETHQIADFGLRVANRQDPHWRFSVDYQPCISFPEQDLLIDPYVLGAWLGDGKSDGPVLCYHPDFPQPARWISEVYGEPTHRWIHKDTGVYYDNWSTPYSFREDIDSLNLKNNKHIPEVYLRSSEKQRLALLAGLIDTDGSIGKKDGRVRFSNANKRLVDDVVELVRGLGYRAGVLECPPVISSSGIVGKQTIYQVTFTPKDGRVWCLIPHKAKRFKTGGITKSRKAIVDIRRCSPQPGRCIQVANADGIYLAGRSLTPTHNSELCSKYFPAWYLGKFPDRRIIVLSYNKDMAVNFTSAARNIFTGSSEDIFDGLKLREDSKSKGRYDVANHSGGVYAAGIDSGIIGYGGHMIIVDDIYKNIQQAFSTKYNEDIRTQWSGTIRHRLEPGGSIVIVLARWKKDDLSGWLLENSRTIERYDPWFEIKIPAICVDELTDPIGRKLGEPLWAMRYDIPALESLEASVGKLVWQAQFQQDPVSIENTMFPTDNWQEIRREDIPRDAVFVRYWDLSAGGQYSDYVSGALVAVDRRHRVFIVDVKHKRFTGNDASHQIDQLVKNTAEQDEMMYEDVRIFIEQAPGAGKRVAEYYVKTLLAGYKVSAIPAASEKAIKAMPLASQQQSLNVYLPTIKDSDGERTMLPWAATFIAECLEFPEGKYDDQVDAASLGYMEALKLLKERSKGKFTQPQQIIEKRREREGQLALANPPEAPAKKKSINAKGRKRQRRFYNPGKL